MHSTTGQISLVSLFKQDNPFAQLVAGADLAMGRLLNGTGHHSRLGLLVHSVFNVGFAAALVYQSLDAALLDGILIAIEGVSGKSHDSAGFRYIVQLFG